VQSGEALLFLAGSTREIAFNLAPFGIPFKLDALGLADWGWAEANSVQLAISQTNAAGGINVGGITYTLVLVAADDGARPGHHSANTLLNAGR
jgi:hypothetical protein